MRNGVLLIFILMAPLWLSLVLLLCFWVKEHLFAKKYRERIKKLIEDSSQEHPWLVEQLADLEYMFDEETASRLRTKKHPAKKAAEEISAIAQEKRTLKIQSRLLQYKVNVYETNFPWLLSFFDQPPSEVFEGKNSNTGTDGYDYYKKWLSVSEYKKLSPTKRCQLALDLYSVSKKNSWQAGIAYERYIGYVYESQGYSVAYVGAVMGKEDRGIDIVARKEKEVVVIQCKRYSQIKQHFIHENTVAQLFGVSAVYRMENPSYTVTSMIYTSSALSREALRFAQYLEIKVIENFPLAPYPLVKCNVSKTGERIYHLPFDQQYDKVQIAGKRNACFATTVAEAESLGFRHAFRWHPEQ